MSIIRVRKEEKYSVIANSVLQNKALSWEARGVMAYLLSKPDGWECRNYDLVNQGPASDYVIRKVMKELQDAGYINRYRKSDGRGTIEWVTEIYETPELNTAFRNGSFSNLESFDLESIDLEKPSHIVSTDPSKYRLTENKDLIAKPKNSQTNGNGTLRSTKAERLANAISKEANTEDPAFVKRAVQLAVKVCDVCKLDLLTIVDHSTQQSLISVSIALAGKEVKPADLDAFSVWWYDNTWQGKRGQPPTPKLIGDHWGQFEARNNNGAKIVQSEDGGFYI